MKKLTLILTLLFLAACSSSEDTITLGFVGPLSGDSALYGVLEQNVVELALDEINSQGGINGKQVEVIYEDGGCTTKDAALAATKLIEVDEVDIILSVCSAEAIAIAPISEANQVLVYAAWSSLPDISHAGEYIFRNIYSDELMGELLAEELSQYKTVGILTEQTNYPVGISNVVKKHFEKENKKLFEENYKQGNQDHRAQLTKLLAQSPQAIFLNPDTPATGIAALDQLDELGYEGKLYANFFGTIADVRSHKLAEGMIFFSEPPAEASEAKRTFFEQYEKTYGEPPSFDYGAAARYDSVYILKNAIEAVGEDSTAIKDWLYEMEPYAGILGNISFDENGDVVGTLPVKNQIKNGEIVQLS